MLSWGFNGSRGGLLLATIRTKSLGTWDFPDSQAEDTLTSNTFDDMVNHDPIFRDTLSERYFFEFVPLPKFIRRPNLPRTVYIGIGPRNMTVGDKVCLLFGCSSAIILTTKDVSRGRHKIVGDAYCDGFMKGEAVTGIEEGTDKPEMFLIE
jgi:hypothetical protein